MVFRNSFECLYRKECQAVAQFYECPCQGSQLWGTSLRLGFFIFSSSFVQGFVVNWLQHSLSMQKKTIFDQVLCKNMDGGYLVYLEQLVEVSFGDFVWRYSGGISPIRAGKGSRLALPPHLSTPVHHHYGNAASQVPLFHPYLPSFFSQLHRNAFILHRPYLYVIPWSMDISIFILTSAGHVVAKSSELQQGSVMISF